MLLDSKEWDKLLKLIHDGQVVPVIGPELLCVPQGENPSVRLYDLWGQALAQQRGIEVAPTPNETPLLYRIANQLISESSRNFEMQPGDIEYEIDHVIRGQPWPLPKSIHQLAEIRDFQLYITTTIDHLMIAALKEARKTRERPLQIIFKLGGNTVSNDLPKDFVPGQRPAVFHLFGATSTDPDGFAATEDELIEFSWALIDHSYAPTRLYDFLHGKRILLLGCDFPDWLERFFIHALTRRPEGHIALWYVSACRQCGLQGFLQRRGAKLLPYSPGDFVAELHQRWLERPQAEPGAAAEQVPGFIPGECKIGAVFISYAREDRAAAMAVREQLEAEGIDTWMDESGLEPGAEFHDVIHDNIHRASFFVAIISRAMDLHGTDRLGRFVLKEWKWAEDENEYRPKSDYFLQPVVADDTPAGADFVDRPFRDLHWTYLREGKLPPEFIECLRQGIRRHRSGTRGNNL